MYQKQFVLDKKSDDGSSFVRRGKRKLALQWKGKTNNKSNTTKGQVEIDFARHNTSNLLISQSHTWKGGSCIFLHQTLKLNVYQNGVIVLVVQSCNVDFSLKSMHWNVLFEFTTSLIILVRRWYPLEWQHCVCNKTLSL